MDETRWQRVKQLFGAARELAAEERSRFLKDRSGGDGELEAEVESLLAHADADPDFLATTGSAALRAWIEENALPMPERLGSFRILSLLGRGGMGVVYLARQERPERLVALKVLPAESVTERSIRRFEHEAEILASLQHTGIAQIYEVGRETTSSGPRPYFAMELVSGLPLTDFARKSGLTIRQKLELFARVCDAVQHAHQRGVIHRDLKPANILVNERGEPKVLDFGIARAANAPLSTTLRTNPGQLLGTLLYMSPEQLAGDPELVDTRADLYALGVVLYELLSGRLPHQAEGRPVTEAIRAICEEDPPSLSSFDRNLRGDLETIVSKALAKDLARRYASASELADDVRRFLRDEPIAARPPSTLYHLGKFAQRNRGLVAGLAASLLVLLLGAAATTWQAIRATGQRDRALEAEGLAARRLDEAQFERDNALAARDFLQRMFSSVQPEQSGHDVRVSEILESASSEIEGSFASQPETAAFLHFTLASAWSALGRSDRTEEELLQAEELLVPEVEPDDRRLLLMRSQMAGAWNGLGRYAEAEEEARAVLARQRTVLGETHKDTLATRRSLCEAILHQDRLEDARSEVEVLLELQRESLGATHLETLETKNSLVRLALRRGLAASSESMAREVLQELVRQLGPEHQTTLDARDNLAQILTETGRWAEAEAEVLSALAVQERVLGEAHPQTLHLLNNLAILLKRSGRLEEARRTYGTVLERIEGTLGSEHKSTLVVKSNLANLLWAQGALAEAEALAREVYLAQVRAVGTTHYQTIGSATTLGNLLRVQGQYEEAEALLRETLTVSQEHLGPDHAFTLTVNDGLANLLIDTGRAREALPLLQDSLERRTRILGQRPELELVQGREALAQALYRTGELEQAEASYRQSFAERKALHGEVSCNARLSGSLLSVVLIDRGQLEEALDLLRAALDGCPTTDAARMAIVERDFGRCLAAMHRWEEAEPRLVHAFEVLRGAWGKAHPHTTSTANALVSVCESLGKAEEAARWAAWLSSGGAEAGEASH